MTRLVIQTFACDLMNYVLSLCDIHLSSLGVSYAFSMIIFLVVLAILNSCSRLSYHRSLDHFTRKVKSSLGVSYAFSIIIFIGSTRSASSNSLSYHRSLDHFTREVKSG